MKVKIKVTSDYGGDMGTYYGEGTTEAKAVMDALDCGDKGREVSLAEGDTIKVEEVD